EAFAERVQSHARLTVADVAERELELALAAEIAHAELVELVERRGRGDLGRRLLLERLRVHGGECIGFAFVHSRSSGSVAGTESPRLERTVSEALRAQSPSPGFEPGRGKQEGRARAGHRVRIAAACPFGP